jgi:hypothetical protein
MSVPVPHSAILEKQAGLLLETLKAVPALHPSPPPFGDSHGNSLYSVAVHDAFFATPQAIQRLRWIDSHILKPPAIARQIILRALELDHQTLTLPSQADLSTRIVCQLMWLSERLDQ